MVRIKLKSLKKGEKILRFQSYRRCRNVLLFLKESQRILKERECFRTELYRRNQVKKT